MDSVTLDGKEESIVRENRDALAIPERERQLLQESLGSVLPMVDDIVSKNYIAELSDFDVVPFPLDSKAAEKDMGKNVRLFKITEMAYEKDEFASHKFATVFSTLSSVSCSVLLIVDSDGQKTSFYMGIRSRDAGHDTYTIKKTLKQAIQGQFPGVKIEDKYENPDIQKLTAGIATNGIASVSCVANVKDNENRLNQAFVQGLEKFALSMQGKKYTAVILANNTSREQLVKLRKDYETIYTQLSPFASKQVSYATNSSTTLSEAVSHTSTQGTSTTDGRTSTTGESTTFTNGTSESTSSPTGASIAISLAASALGTYFAGPVGAWAGGMVASAFNKNKTNGTNSSTTKGSSTSEGISETYSENQSLSDGQTRTTGSQTGTSQTVTLTQQDKSIGGILERIDTQLKRIREFESLGMWECAAYFMAEKLSIAEIAAASYKALMSGENSGVEASAINLWSKSGNEYRKEMRASQVAMYVKNFMHPVFKYRSANGDIPVTPGTFVSGNELALHMGLPRHSVRGFPVIEHASFSPEIVRYDSEASEHMIDLDIGLGSVFNMGSDAPGLVSLDRESLTMHTFITGSTGSGKSNTVYVMLKELMENKIKFMVIEPAKGEYKNVFGNREDVAVLGTNPNYSKLLKINPFRFPAEVHVLEHIDRLLDVFNVCWPMYAAMPAVLKDALSNSYESCGWDLDLSKNRYSSEVFPTFPDLLAELTDVVSNSAYSQETKGDYIGALSTRVKSLTNGLNGQIFTTDETDNDLLFDENIIIDLSRVGSLETKALIMGILLIRLHEHRMTRSEGMNQALRHVTVLEEAHNLLKRTSTEQNTEAPSLLGKSVEMISNAIAEMRTYGEGFIIADQSPNAVDASAIRNTNTKIIMRLPDEADRRIAGKSAALKDEQVEEIARLPRGVAVVYQNDWVAPVLCKIKKFDSQEEKYNFVPTEGEQFDERRLKRELMKFLLKGRTSDEAEPDIELIERDLKKFPAQTKTKLAVHMLLKEYGENGKLTIWGDEKFSELAQLVTELTCGKERLERIITSHIPAKELRDILFLEVDRWIPELSYTLKVSVCQCLMKQYSKVDDDRLKLYAEWRDFVKGGEVR